MNRNVKGKIILAATAIGVVTLVSSCKFADNYLYADDINKNINEEKIDLNKNISDGLNVTNLENIVYGNEKVSSKPVQIAGTNQNNHIEIKETSNQNSNLDAKARKRLEYESVVFEKTDSNKENSNQENNQDLQQNIEEDAVAKRMENNNEQIIDTKTDEIKQLDYLPEVDTSNFIILGDSRTNAMSLNIDSNTYKSIFIAKGATDYKWFDSTARNRLEELLQSGKEYNVILHFGVNDCANYRVGAKSNHCELYAEDMNKLIEKYPNSHFYFASVNPLNGVYHTKYRDCGYIDVDELNAEVDKFNSYMKENCNATYITTNEYCRKYGFETYDGIHYKASTDRKIYNYMINFVLEN